MTSTTLNPQPWMTDIESRGHKEFIRQLLTQFKLPSTDIPPLVALRIEEITHAAIAIRRMEHLLYASDNENAGNADLRKGFPAAVDACTKARDRLRRAIKELEKLCGDATPAPQKAIPPTQPKSRQHDRKSKKTASTRPAEPLTTTNKSALKRADFLRADHAHERHLLQQFAAKQDKGKS